MFNVLHTFNKTLTDSVLYKRSKNLILKMLTGSFILAHSNLTRESALPVQWGGGTSAFWVRRQERGAPSQQRVWEEKKKTSVHEHTDQQLKTQTYTQQQLRDDKMVAKQRIRMANEKHSKNITQRGNVAKSTVSLTTAAVLRQTD